MSEYVIITDTSADIPASVLDKGQIQSDPYGISVKWRGASP